MSHQKFEQCIQACNECAAECEHCTTACLNEKDVQDLARCIQLERYCADMCRMAAGFMARSDEKISEPFVLKFCMLCAEICDECGKECEKHSRLEHCRVCAEACIKCASECRRMQRQYA